MKNIHALLIIAILCTTAFSAFAQGTIEVTVKNIKEAKGTIRVGLFTNENDFLKKVSQGKVVKATSAEVTVVFENLPAGDYAVSVIHDENENGELDTNFMGIPKEGFAFGNNAMGTFGPPSFEKAKVKVDNNRLKQEIMVKYM